MNHQRSEYYAPLKTKNRPENRSTFNLIYFYLRKTRPNEKKQSENGGGSIDINCKCKANLKTNDLVTHLMHLINNDERKQKSTVAINRMKCCRPNANEMINNLKRSLFWLNNEKMNNVSQFGSDSEHMWYLSQKLIDDNIMEW